MFDQSSLPPFDLFSDALIPVGALNSPAELHGLLCGYLCGGGRYEPSEWMRVAWEALDLAAQPDRDLDDLIHDLYNITLQQLRDGEFGFQLLIPDDDAAIEQRLTSLSQWCHGFLQGMGSSGLGLAAKKHDIDIDEALPDTIQDILEDFSAFVKIKIDEEEDDDVEADYMELVEYIRIGAISVFTEIGAEADPEESEESDEATLLH